MEYLSVLIYMIRMLRHSLFISFLPSNLGVDWHWRRCFCSPHSVKCREGLIDYLCRYTVQWSCPVHAWMSARVCFLGKLGINFLSFREMFYRMLSLKLLYTSAIVSWAFLWKIVLSEWKQAPESINCWLVYFYSCWEICLFIYL